MDLKLEGKGAVVCAASRGLGRAIAEALAREGAKVLICARGESELRKTAESIGARWVIADLSKGEDREGLIREALRALGGVDILVNNSGGPPAGSFASFSAQHWRDTFEHNFLSFVHLAQLVLPVMKERGWGRIINLASYAALEAVEGLILSNGVRPAVVAWTRALAREVAKDGIGVVAICPGLIYTERVKEIVQARSAREGKPADQLLMEWVAQVPMGRMGNPEEIGNLAAYLASPLASFITGSTIVIDGGIMRRLV